MEGQLPVDFRCPISLEVMSDPVILSSGHTFDRSSIQRWLDAGHRTCPISKLPLPEPPPLIPNHALRSLISTFTPISSSKLPTLPPHQKNDENDADEAIRALISPASPPESKLRSLSRLVRRTKQDSSLRRQLAESGAVLAVLRCAGSCAGELHEKALSLLLNLSLDDDNKVGLVAEGAIERVVGVVGDDSSSPESRATACTVLTSLAVVEVNKATIGAYPGAIGSLVGLVGCGKGREAKEAATALYAVCCFPDNQRRAVESGAVGVLVRVCGEGLERAVEVLSVLVKCKEGREEMGRATGCVRVLANVVRSGSQKGLQCALFTLNWLCRWSERLCVEARREGVVDACAGLVGDGNEKIRRNALGLVESLYGTCKRGKRGAFLCTDNKKE